MPDNAADLNAHVFITGAPRSATRWLRDMIDDNIAVKPRTIKHEALRNNPIRMLMDWTAPGFHVTVCQSTSWLLALQRQFPDLQVALLLRDPVESTLSITSNSYDGKHTPGQGIFRTALCWGAMEQMLRIADENRITVLPWHFDYYTTAEGFKALADSLQIPLKDPVEAKAKRYATPKEMRQYREEWPEIILKQIEEVFSEHVLLKRAYDKAKAYADEKLGR